MSPERAGEVPSIKYFGTSWHERGLAYWRRRSWLVLLALLMVSLVVLAIGVLVSALFALVPSTWGRLLSLVVVAIPIVLSCYSAYVKLRRSPTDRDMHRPMSFTKRSKANVRAGGAAGVAAGVAASGGAGIGGALAAVGSLFVVGQVLGFLMISLGRYVNDEEWQMAHRYGVEK